MTEQEWLSSTDPEPMLEYLCVSKKEDKNSLRRFAVGCCHRIWPLLPDEGKTLLEIVEQFGEGTVTRHTRDSAVAAFRAIHGRFGADSPVLRAVYRCKTLSLDVFAANMVARQVALAVSTTVDPNALSAACTDVSTAERVAQVALLHCVVGNPFQPCIPNPDWFTPTVIALAKAIWETSDFSRLPILADALEDAGCTSPQILTHCRRPGDHCRGCWAVDLLLAKE